MVFSIIITILIFIHIFFFLSLLTKNFGIIDIGWGLGIVLIALISYMHHPISVKNALLLLAVTCWGVRLALYIFARSRGHGEDFRYKKLREEWKPHENRSAYLKVFLFQGLLMMIISLPVSVGMAQESKTVSIINWIGLFVWITGFALEVSSDSYLNWFKGRPENTGKICTTGPWRLCRFPNYFGEVMLWYGVWLLSFELKTAWTIIGPMAINFLILKVSGVPFLEEKYKKREEYLAYAKRVPKFIPFSRPEL